jgi:nicotinamidase-related amidase
MSDRALLLMDYQEAICRESGAIGSTGSGAEVVRRDILANAARVLEAARASDVVVIFVRVAFDADYRQMTSASTRFQGLRKAGLLLKSDPATAIVAELAPRDGETVVEKGCVNPFVGTALQSVLTRHGARELVLGGVATNHVVESTARYACDIGYRVTVLEDLCASFSAELHDFTVKSILPNYAKVSSSEKFLREMEVGHESNR